MKSHASLLLLTLVAAGCECGPKTNTRSPKLELPAADGSELTAFDFGQVQVGATTTARIRVHNGGFAQLIVDSATASAPFGVEPEYPLAVELGADGSFSVTFSPTVADQRETGTLTLNSNDPNRPSVTVTLSGTGITAVARGQPSPLAFGDVYVGESRVVPLTITNAGSNALDVQMASFQGAPSTVSANLASVVKQIPAGMSQVVDVTWAPTAEGALAGSVHLTLSASQGGALDVPLTGRGVQAVPKMCFKFDDTGLESCADAVSPALVMDVGKLCDNRLYGETDAGALQCTTLTGQRSGKLYYRNEGNVPVRYSLQYQPLPYANVRCGGASGSSDFLFANAPLLADGGQSPSFNAATVALPLLVSDPLPWESSQVAVTYRANSLCREDAADQARILWTRQGEPAGTNRAPGSMFVTLIGGSKLPRGLSANQGVGAVGSGVTSPVPVDFIGVLNGGDAALVVNAVELWEELPNVFADAGIPDAGGPNGGIFQLCTPNPNSDCAQFMWSTDGGDPNLRAPTALLPNPDGGSAQAVLGKFIFGPLGSGACVNNGVACPNKLYTVYAVVRTNDPYSPTVISRLTGVAQ